MDDSGWEIISEAKLCTVSCHEQERKTNVQEYPLPSYDDVTTERLCTDVRSWQQQNQHKQPPLWPLYNFKMHSSQSQWLMSAMAATATLLTLLVNCLILAYLSSTSSTMLEVMLSGHHSTSKYMYLYMHINTRKYPMAPQFELYLCVPSAHFIQINANMRICECEMACIKKFIAPKSLIRHRFLLLVGETLLEYRIWITRGTVAIPICIHTL